MNKHTTFRVSALSLALFSALSYGEQAQQHDELETIIVSGEALSLPNQVITDAKQPRQPLPAHDGADYLKTIPGFSMVRKGGASGDPVFRGMAASRLTILNDG
ncbi:TonB-dependent copper receptor, partial [Bowmanella dokdonensis]|nr:TonB-dependent copper receptor [Bowmanella dokdonensis]